jgi:hypothetical protein
MEILVTYLITHGGIGAIICILWFLFELKIIYGDPIVADHTYYDRSMTLLFYCRHQDRLLDTLVNIIIILLVSLWFVVAWPFVLSDLHQAYKELSAKKQQLIYGRFLQTTYLVGLLNIQHRHEIRKKMSYTGKI